MLDHFEDMLEDDPDNPPAALLRRPELNEAQWQYVRAFFQLSASRSSGFAPNAISIVDAICYANAAGFCDHVYFLTVMQEADAVFLEWVANKK
jgi:hypothetical protein|tara:strand:+ start:18570 stop:18848 length:279 start_codon:yes stop_codon:yes gene_type:complete